MLRIIVALSLVAAGISPTHSQTLPLLPNFFMTPGAVVPNMTLHKLCHTKWGKDARHVTAAMKRQVFANYGLIGNTDPACIRDSHGRRCEVDHLISRELGGADDMKNLWPQPYGSQPWNAVRKDCVETRLHKEVCARHITLKQAQEAIRFDWTAAYLRYYEYPEPGKKCTPRTN